MKISSLLLFLLFLSSSCGLRQREEAIKLREAEANQKQQKLILWEQQLTQNEQDLINRERRLDSTKKEIDSVVIHGPSLVGKWQVKMQCVETSCDGSAIGDVKTEQWEFSAADNNSILVKAFANKNLARTYSGAYTQSGLQLVDNGASKSAKMEVTLRILNEKKMDGLREIILPNCKTTYSITADRM